jgi:hypothetical protein
VAAGGIWLSPNLDPTSASLPPPSSPLFPTPPHCLSLDTIIYIKVSTLHLSSFFPSPAVWNTLDDADADSFLPPHFRACCCTSKCIYSFYIPFTNILLCFACPPCPTSCFFQPSTWWLIHVEAPFLHAAAKVSTQVSIHDGSWRCLVISIPFLPPSPAPQPSSTFLPPASHLSSPTPICSIVWWYEVSWYVIISVCPVV